MPNLIFKSERQIQTDIINKIRALLGIDDINAGSVLDVLTSSVAQEIFAEYIQMSQIVRLVDLNAMTGDDLDNKAFEYGLTRKEATKATGKIDILRPVGFVKVSTTFYAGSAAPIVGNTTINVNNASSVLFGTSGTLILGRGTSNLEEVTYSVAPVNNINYWTFTLDSSLINNHANEESVILKQGIDQNILAGTLVVIPASSNSAEIRYTTNTDTVLLAGEAVVEEVDITATEAGILGNISIGMISGTQAFPVPPFLGARAENNAKITTGTDRQTDDELRDAIKNHIQSLSAGTKQAILNAIVGLVDTETAKRVVSANIILPQDTNTPVKVYIDDGTGFEPSFLSQGFETVIASATGGETRIQLDIKPLVKAQLETNNPEQYDFSGGPKTLTYTVGLLSETIQFNVSDFEFPESATAEEVVTVINDESTLIEARTSDSGIKVVITSKEDINEDIQVTGGTANSILGFPTEKKSTLYLYIDDILQSKDGETAKIDSGNQAPFNLAAINGGGSVVLNLIIDGKTANPQVVTFQASDFTDYSACIVSEVIEVINAQLAGATAIATNNGTQIRLISNTELNSNSKLEITGGNANDATNGFDFITSEVSGVDGDYTLNNELGTIELTNPLTVNQSVTVGSQYTRAKLKAANSENYAPANGETLVIAVDGGADQTITFDATFAAGLSASATASFINAQLAGATAIVREIGSLNYIEISTNSYNESYGSLIIKSSSTANSAFSFTLDSLQINQRPHKAYKEATIVGPFEFAENDALVVVVDNDIINNTYSVTLDYDGSVSSATSTTVFSDSTFINVFQSNDVLNDFYLAFLSGANSGTFSGVISSVSNPVGNTFRYNFSAPQVVTNYAIGDLVNFSDLTNFANNGQFVITGITVNYIEVLNPDGILETGSVGTALVSEKRQITSYNAVTGEIQVGVAFSNIPSNADSFTILPSTINNLVYFMNNIKITSLSLKADIQGINNNTLLQISSKSEGSNGYIQITGGSANSLFLFNTNVFRGLQAYDYYTGLLKLVHKTIYGDDTDLISYPGVGAAGIKFQILAPTNNQISVSVDVTLNEGITLTQIENEIKSAITGYINNLGVGEDIIIERIRAAVIGIDGIFDVVLNAPLANINIADNEVARIKSNNIIIG